MLLGKVCLVFQQASARESSTGIAPKLNPASKSENVAMQDPTPSFPGAPTAEVKRHASKGCLSCCELAIPQDSEEPRSYFDAERFVALRVRYSTFQYLLSSLCRIHVNFLASVQPIQCSITRTYPTSS